MFWFVSGLSCGLKNACDNYALSTSQALRFVLKQLSHRALCFVLLLPSGPPRDDRTHPANQEMGLVTGAALVQLPMVQTVWAKVDGRRRLYLIDDM